MLLYALQMRHLLGMVSDDGTRDGTDPAAFQVSTHMAVCDMQHAIRTKHLQPSLGRSYHSCKPGDVRTQASAARCRLCIHRPATPASATQELQQVCQEQAAELATCRQQLQQYEVEYAAELCRLR